MLSLPRDPPVLQDRRAAAAVRDLDLHVGLAADVVRTLREVELEAKLNELREGWNEAANQPKVTPEDIAEVVAMWTGVPVSRIAYGLPVGGDLEYADEVTLGRAISNRRPL